MITSVDWIMSWEMKRILESDGGTGSKTDDLRSRDFNIVEFSGFHLIS